MASTKGTSETDRRFMAAALRIGRRSLGRTAPNPAVGAIIVAANGGASVVVGRGWTAPGGRPHRVVLFAHPLPSPSNPTEQS